MADLGVNGIGEIDWRGLARQHNDLAFGRESVNLFRIEIDLKGGKKFGRIRHIALPFNYLSQPRQPLFVLGGDWAVLILPVRRDAFFRHAVHFFGADLHFERRTLLGDHRGMQRLVKIWTRHGDEVFDSPGNGTPHVVHNSQHRVAILQRLRDDAHGVEIVHLVHADFLADKFLMNAEQALDAAFHLGRYPCFFQFVAQSLFNSRQELLALFAAGLDCVVHLLVGQRIEIAESQIFELAANLSHAQAVGYGPINFQSFLGDFLLAFWRKMFQRSHVVQPVGKLNQDDANVVDHSQHHFAQILSLLFLSRSKVNLADLGDSLNDMRDLLAEFLADVNNRDRRIFDRVVQQSGRDRHRIHLHFREDLRNSERMDQVRLARGAKLPGMIFLGIFVGFAHQFQIIAGAVGTHGAQQFPELGDRQGGGRDLFAQRRHRRL